MKKIIFIVAVSITALTCYYTQFGITAIAILLALLGADMLATLNWKALVIEHVKFLAISIAITILGILLFLYSLVGDKNSMSMIESMQSTTLIIMFVLTVVIFKVTKSNNLMTYSATQNAQIP